METGEDVPEDATNITSPSQLQEVTLDPDSTTFTYMGMQTPNVAAGRSVKDFEEQLSNLRKENFNLKLRIYFLEERMGANFNVDKENAIKKNIELSVELESLRKEVDEKQELLCQAVKAMELEEEEHKKDVNSRDKEIERLKEDINNLHQNAQVALKTNDNLTTAGNQLTLYAAHLQLDNAKASDILHDLHGQIKELDKALKKERNRGDHLERLLAAADCESVRSKEFEIEIRRKDNRLITLEQDLKDSNFKIYTLENQLRELDKQATAAVAELEIKVRELKKKEVELSHRENQMEDLKKALIDAEGQMDAEQRKTEKYRCSLTKRNVLLAEKDSYIERLETKIRQLESCLKEVKGASPGRKSKSQNIDADSLFSVHCSPAPTELSATATTAPDNPSQLSENSNHHHHHHHDHFVRLSAGDQPDQFTTSSPSGIDGLREELRAANEEISRLKGDQYKAVKMIKSMIKTRKEHTNEIEQLKALVEAKDRDIDVLQKKIEHLEMNDEFVKEKRIDTSSPRPKNESAIYRKINELNLTAAVSPTENNENSSMSSEMGGGQQLCEQYKALSIELENQVQVLMDTLKEKDSLLNKYKDECENHLAELKEKQDRIIDLEFELLSTTQDKTDASFNEKDSSTFWKHEVAEKDKEISRLELELRKRTGDLQTIVNKELWEKNREIEKLQKRYGNQLELNEKLVLQLKKDIEDRDLQLTILKDKISELEVQTDILPVKDNEECLNKCLEERNELKIEVQKLREQVNNESDDISLKREIFNLHAELEKSEKLRNESQDVCSILSTRLEELCQFLDSLLRQKSVLGFLGNKQKSRLRKIIDQSLDFSRTLSMSISLNPNQSLLQLSDLSKLLDVTNDTDETSLGIIPDEVSLKYENHLKYINADSVSSSTVVAQQAEVINSLRQQVDNLKKEIELRDVELENKTVAIEGGVLKNDHEFVEAVIDLQSSLSESPKHAQSPQKILRELIATKENLPALNTTSTTLKNINTESQSESECWSEPDRNVSMQRMGIIEDKVKMARKGRFGNTECISTESTEDERVVSSSKMSSKRNTIVSLHEQVCELEDKLKLKEKQLMSAQTVFMETQRAFEEEKAKLREYVKREEQLILKMKMTEIALKEAENNLELTKKTLEDSNALVATLQQFKSDMDRTIKTKDKVTHDRMNELEKEKEAALRTAREAEQLAEQAKKEIEAAELKLRDLQNELVQVEVKTRQSLDDEYKIKLKNMENDLQSRMSNCEQNYKEKLESLRQQCESQILAIKNSIESIKETCEENQLRNIEVTNQTTEVQFIINELENIRQSIKLTRAKMNEMEANEDMYKQKIHKLEIQNEEKIKSLYVQLDAIALQHSETMLEKTKLMNEKNMLEQEIQKYIEREQELTRQVNDFQKEFIDIKHSFQNQLGYHENLKVSLETKVNHLEVSNAELRRKFVSNRNINVHDDMSSFSLPNSPSKYAELYPNKTLPIPLKKSYYRQFSDTTASSQPGANVPSKSSFGLLQLQNIVDFEHDTRQGNSSPDLGIESDQGRFSSLEANVNIPRPLLPTLELTESMSNLLDCDNSVQDILCSNEDCLIKIKGMMNENCELKKKLLRTRRALEETVTQLTLANKRKKEVEKTICKQIHKTSQVLRKAKANLDSGSETEHFSKK